MEQQKPITESFFPLSTMPTEVANVLQLFPPADLDWKPKSWDGIPGEKFSAIEQICHLRDIEQEGYHKRIEAMLNESNPTLTSIEGYGLSTQLNYKAANLTEAISAFHSAREKTIMMIKNIERSQWNRIGYFDGYGPITLRALIHFLCSHDLEHLASLRWLLGKLEGERLN
jgi:DinB superfamily